MTPDSTRHLRRLTARRRAEVAATLQRSAERGRPATDVEAEALIAYAAGDIDSHEYVARVLGLPTLESPERDLEAVPDEPPSAKRPAAPEDAAAAYVGGRLTAQEFLRAARGVSA